MAPLLKFLALAAALLLLSAETANAQSCPNYLQLAACMGAVRPGSSSGPSSSCCTALSAYANNSNRASCLCSNLITARNALGANNIDMSKALGVPKTCGYGGLVPKGYRCAGYSVPSEVSP